MADEPFDVSGAEPPRRGKQPQRRSPPKALPVVAAESGQRKGSSGNLPVKLVLIIGGVLGGGVLLCCGGCGVLFLIGSKLSGKSAAVTHDPYTQVKMPEIPSDRVHNTDMNLDNKGPKTFEPSKPVSLKDISKVDFTRGPNGEPIEMERCLYGSSLSQQGYFYMNKAGEKVLHGPWKHFKPDRQEPTLETLYVHGIEKCEYVCYGQKPTRLDQYRGDDDHTRVELEYHRNGGIAKVLRYKVIHEANPSKGEARRPVLHGLCVAYYDNTLVDRYDLSEHVAGRMKEEFFENGVSVGFAIYDRSGRLATSSGRLK